MASKKWFGLVAGLLWFAAVQPLFAAPAAPAAQTSQKTQTNAGSSRFIRFLLNSESEGHLDTAITRYVRDDGVSVDLVAAVHIADGQYFTNLNRIFARYDAVLYEMVKPKGTAVDPSKKSNNMVSMLQEGMKNLLGLEFQLDAIDYSATNFVHADMDTTTFFEAQAANGESILGLIIREVLAEQFRPEASADSIEGLQMLIALVSGDSSSKLKILFAKQLDRLEGAFSGFDQGQDGKGSVLVSGRNEVAFKVLQEQIRLHKRKLAIFYGAGHMIDLEKRLTDDGFQKRSEVWLTAWDVQPTQ